MDEKALPSCPVGQFTQGIFSNLVLLESDIYEFNRKAK